MLQNPILRERKQPQKLSFEGEEFTFPQTEHFCATKYDSQ